MKRTPKRKNSILKVEKITNATRELFSTEGYHSVSTNHIADAAGVPIGSVYDYFEDKGDIALYLMEEVTHDVQGIQKKIAEQKTASWMQFLELLQDELTDYCHENMFALQAMQFAVLADYPSELTVGATALRTALKSILQSLRFDGHILEPSQLDDLLALTVAALATSVRTGAKFNTTLVCAAYTEAVAHTQAPPTTQGSWVQAEKV